MSPESVPSEGCFSRRPLLRGRCWTRCLARFATVGDRSVRVDPFPGFEPQENLRLSPANRIRSELHWRRKEPLVDQPIDGSPRESGDFEYLWTPHDPALHQLVPFAHGLSKAQRSSASRLQQALLVGLTAYPQAFPQEPEAGFRTFPLRRRDSSAEPPQDPDMQSATYLEARFCSYFMASRTSLKESSPRTGSRSRRMRSTKSRDVLDML